ncbi:MAG TPA: hypothetical protein VF247_11635 [Candidatus Krumholzibacteria bacterium]
MNTLLRRTVYLVAGLALASTPVRSAPHAPAAVLTSCKGVVTVIQAGTAGAASFGLPLGDGDEVKTGAGGEAEIMFAAGNWVQIGPNSSMKIKGRPGDATEKPADEAKAGGKSGNFEVVQTFLKLKSSDGTSSITGLRSGEKPSRLEPVSPGQGRVRANRPVFRWKSEDPSLELRLTIYADRAEIWHTDVTGVTTLAYPADAPPLAPGRTYAWTLETTDPLVSPPLRTPATFFEVLAPADAKMLDTDLSALDANRPGPVTYHLTRASLFFDRGLVDDAIAETESAVSADPENDSLHTILSRLYAEAGRSRDALAELEKAKP